MFQYDEHKIISDYNNPLVCLDIIDLSFKRCTANEYFNNGLLHLLSENSFWFCNLLVG